MPDDRRSDLGSTGELDDIEALLRELEPADLEPIAPPPSVWSGIEQLLADDIGPTSSTASVDAGTTGDVVVPLASRRRAPAYLAAAAALVLLVVGAVTVLVQRDGATVVATARLAHDPATFDPLGADAAATARLVAVGDGYAIELDDTVLPDVDAADLELWLIEADPDGQILDVAPVALLDGSDRYAVPAGLDVSTHTIVDISIEPRDGDETHSGRSILRAALTTA